MPTLSEHEYSSHFAASLHAALKFLTMMPVMALGSQTQSVPTRDIPPAALRGAGVLHLLAADVASVCCCCGYAKSRVECNLQWLMWPRLSGVGITTEHRAHG